MRVLTHSKLLSNLEMDNKECRHRHLVAAIERFGTIERLAAATETNPKHLSQLKNRTRNVGDKMARKMEKGLNLPNGAWDRPPTYEPHTPTENPKVSEGYNDLHISQKLRTILLALEGDQAGLDKLDELGEMLLAQRQPKK